MKKALMIVAIIGIIVIAGSVLYYFVFYRPGISREELAFKKEQYDLEQKEKQENKIKCEECLKKADEFLEAGLKSLQGGNATNEDLSLVWKMYQDRIANCYKQYGN